MNKGEIEKEKRGKVIKGEIEKGFTIMVNQGQIAQRT